MLTRFSSIAAVVSTVLALTFISLQTAIAADQCTSSNNSTANAALSIGVLGAGLASQTINAVLVTQDNIGLMADRILYTELQIGAMANRIVYVTQFSQTNSLVAIYQIVNLVYLGNENSQYKYSGTLVKVSSRPFGW